MTKKYCLKLEYSIILLVLLGIILFVVPFSFSNTRQAGFISKWNEKFNRLEYMFSVINAHISDDMLKSMNKASSAEEREKLLVTIIKPYMRVNTEIYPSKHYKPRYMNGTKIFKGQKYYFDEFYFAENNTILGIKDVQTETADDAFFIMMFDINGLIPPNRWGKDIFGVSIFDNGKIEPFGYNEDLSALKEDCSNSGTGVGCSYYYKIGGGFDD